MKIYNKNNNLETCAVADCCGDGVTAESPLQAWSGLAGFHMRRLHQFFRSFLFLMAAALFFQCTAYAAITYVGSASNPADNGRADATVVAVTPPAGMQSGDLVVLIANARETGQTLAISNAGGQTWTAETANTTNTTQRIFWARYNGTWLANPSVSFPGGANSTTVVMHVFRPTAVFNTWAIDVALTNGSFTAGAGGLNKTIAGINTVTDGALVLATWASPDDNQWAVQTAGWTHAGNSQYRNRDGADASQSAVYMVMPTAGATGNVVNRQTANGGDAGNSGIIAFREIQVPPPTYYSRANAAWGTGSTWSLAGCGGASAAAVPVAGANVVICNGNTVTFNTTTPAGNFGSLTVQNGGTLNLGDGANRVLTFSGDITNNGTITSTAVAGTKTLTAGGLITNNDVFRFAGTVAMTVNANGGIVNTGTLDVSAASNVTHLLNVRADFVNDGTVQFRPDANSLVTTVFDGTVAQNISGSTATTTLYNLTLNNANGLTIGGTHNVTVLNVLTLTDGVLTTGSNVIYVSNNAAGGVSRTGGHVDGSLTWAMPTGSPGARIFPVGTGATYSPVELTFTAVTTGGDITARATVGDHPDVDNSGLDSTQTVNRYWTLGNAGAVFTDYSATFTWVNPDIDVGATTAVFEAQRFEPQYPGDGDWSPTTAAARNPTDIQISGVTGFGDFAVGQPLSVAGGLGRYNAFDTDTPGGSNVGPIKTKVAGTPFTVDIVALRNNRSIDTDNNDTIRVELLDASDSSGTQDNATACNSSWTVIQTITPDPVFINNGPGDEFGRKTISVTENNVWPIVRFRITRVGGGFRQGCSTDAFAIRPASFSVSVTDADWATAGTGRALNNSSASGGNVHKAGQPFTVTVVPAPVTATNYDGTPTLSALDCTLPGSCVNGTLTLGTFAGTGTRTSSTANYSEAGAFNLTLFDDGFAAIDATDTPADCSPTGRFVCQSPAPLSVGRFVPDRFEFSAPSTPMLLTFGNNSCGSRSFTYVGQPFWYNPVMLPAATVQAVNAAGVITVNYPFNTALSRPSIVETYADASAPGAAPVDFSAIGTVAASSGAGTGSYTASSTGVLRYGRTTPVSEFNAAISLTVNASDTTEVAVTGNGTISAAAPLVFDGGGTGIAFDAGNTIRYGRLRLIGASGARQLPLRIPFETQYWTGTFFALNAQDTCTTVNSSNVALGNIIGGISTGVTSVSALSGGRGTITLNPPNASGSVDVSAVLGTSAAICPVSAPQPPGSGALPWLRGQWCGAANDRDPTVRARFGVRRGSNEVIFMRENY